MKTTSFITPVTAELQEVEAYLLTQADGANSELGVALKHLLSAGGKRIRPVMCLLTARMLGASHKKMVILATAVELLHTATLVHDDLIDGALLRRGNPTLNSHWSAPATVLTGDFLFARSAKLAAETDHLPLMKLFSETLATIVNGELNQLFCARGFISREDYYNRIYAKTASLIEMTTRSAAMISPAGRTAVRAMKDFGYNLGMAFQIVDDILDFNGEQVKLGKPVGSDLLQGLVTLPAIYYAEAHPDDPDVICLSSGCYNEHERMERLVGSIRKSQSVDLSLAEALKFKEKALDKLSGMPEGIESQSLRELADYIVQRRN